MLACNNCHRSISEKAKLAACISYIGKFEKPLILSPQYLKKKYNKLESDAGYLLEVDTDYAKGLHESHRDLPFLAIKKENLLTTL